jgi:hypothetical protein
MVETAKQQEAVQERMKRYADPRTGTISYSGADFSAVVYLPLSQEQLTQKIAMLQREHSDMWKRINAHTGPSSWDTQQWFDELDIIKSELEELGKIKITADQYIRPVKLFDIQTITISSHREKFPVRALGRINAKSHTRGSRTLAGSMIFTLFNKYALWDLIQASSAFYSSGVGIQGSDSGYPEFSTVLPDQLPPFDITLVASNELGDSSYMVIYGLEITNDGRTISIQDIITENVMQFYCRDFDDLRPLIHGRVSSTWGVVQKTASDIAKERYTELQRRRIRLNPFI